MEIDFINESNVTVPITRAGIEQAVKICSKEFSRTYSLVEIVFVGPKQIVDINKKYLNRDYITDIISFSYHESDDETIEGTLFCCADRIQEQAQQFDEDTEKEFTRIILHGLIHLAGYDDQTTEDKQTMTTLENTFLKQLGYAA